MKTASRAIAVYSLPLMLVDLYFSNVVEEPQFLYFYAPVNLPNSLFYCDNEATKQTVNPIEQFQKYINTQLTIKMKFETNFPIEASF